MRQAKKEIQDRNVIIELLNTCHVGRLGTIGPDGFPMIKPLNFAYDEGRIYFHSAKAGEKIDHLLLSSKVCFEVDLPIALVRTRSIPCRAEYLYRSVVIRGRARVSENAAERLRGLQLLMKKYQPDGGYSDFPDDKTGITAVVCIEIEQMVGKEDLGKEGLKAAVLKALQDKVPLPIVLERE